ncbi:MAG: hypothetical protein HRU15_13080, partial [Planctomycetes bacterium]|nr:hypothetical protein [Planctomycetota bacterium]
MISFADWIQSTKNCDIVYAALCTTRSDTPPWELVGISYMAIGEYQSYHRGAKEIRFPNGYMRLASCLEGAKTSEPEAAVGMWSVAIDVAGVAAYTHLKDQSLLEQARVQNPKKLKHAFQSVANAFMNRSQVSSAYYLKSSVLNLCAVVL